MVFSRTKRNINKIKDKIDENTDKIVGGIDETKFHIRMKADELADNLDKTKNKIKRKTDELARDIRQKLIALFFLALAGFFIWLLFVFIYFAYDFHVITWFKSLPYIYPIFQHVFDEVSARTSAGFYYLFSFSSLFFLPMPLEFIYLGFLKQGFVFKNLYLFTLLGVITGQCINFMLGRFFGFIIKPYIKRRTRITLQKRLHKYGVYAIAVMHLLPLPYPLFNFIVGLTRFNFFKWLIVMLPSLLINYLIFYWIFLKLM